MSTGPVYVLDSDVFMTAARSYYAFDLVPTFWRVLVGEASNGRLLSIDRVKAEIDRGNDRLRQWANNDFARWFEPTNRDKILRQYGLIMRWASSHGLFKDAAKAEFADAENADPWLVAYAKVTNRTVVTNEQYSPDSRRKIKIPNVCTAFGVDYVDTFQMLRALGIRLS
jgi:hypothetical protein